MRQSTDDLSTYLERINDIAALVGKLGIDVTESERVRLYKVKNRLVKRAFLPKTGLRCRKRRKNAEPL